MFNRISRIFSLSFLFSFVFLFYAEAKIDERLVIKYDDAGFPISIHVPEDLHNPDLYSFSDIATLSEITVDANNPNFASKDGVLYSKDMKIMYRYPLAKTDTEFVIPDSVEEIRSGFYSPYLEKLILGENVNTLCNQLCYNNYPSKFMQYIVDDKNLNYTAVGGVLYSKDMKTLISYPSGKIKRKFTVPFGVETIKSWAFQCSNLVEVNLPETLKTIENSSFNFSYFLEELLLPDGLINFDGSFQRCSNLRKLTIPKTVEDAGYLYSDYIANIVFLSEHLPQGDYCSAKIYHQTNLKHDDYCLCNIDKIDTWAEKEFRFANVLKLITERTSYGYKSVITRSEFAELVVNMVEKFLGRELKQQENSFEDTYNIAAEKAYTAGIVDGVGNNCFSPGQLVTREQIAAMLCRAITYIETETGKDIIQLSETIPDVYADKADVSDWAVSSVATLNAADIMKGTSDNTLSPKNNTTVQEAILLVYRIYTLCV